MFLLIVRIGTHSLPAYGFGQEMERMSVKSFINWAFALVLNISWVIALKLWHHARTSLSVSLKMTILPLLPTPFNFFAAGWNDWHQHHRCDRAMPPFSPMSSAKKADLIESGYQLTVITSCITYISLASIYFNSQCINVVQRASCVINVLTACKNFRNLIAQCQQIAMVHSFPASNV